MVMTIVNPSKIPTSETSEVMSASGGTGGGASPATSTCSSVGRWKAPPVCVEASLKETAMTTQVLSKSTFPPDFLPVTTTTSSVDTSNVKIVSTTDHHRHHHHHAIPVSSSSSTCTRDSDTGVFSDVEVKHDATTAAVKTPESTLTPSRLLRSASDRMNSIVSLRKTSRQGRLSQRWVTDPDTANVIRLTTGCVPILRDGKILFVSASRKAEWILPKGGWEKDETMEESAVRECFEEAGVLGVLGPKLNEIQYETRKAKKRRMEQEQQQQKKQATEEAVREKKVSVTKQESSEQQESSNGSNPSTAATSTSTSSTTSPAAPPKVLSEETMSRIRKQLDVPRTMEASGETSSVVSAVSTATYSQARMTLFPLYVTHVADAWPESGRFRKAVDIDEAIEMLESRPELKAALLQVKEKGLHLPASESTRSASTQPRRPPLL